MKTLWLAFALFAAVTTWHEWRMSVFRSETARREQEMWRTTNENIESAGMRAKAKTASGYDVLDMVELRKRAAKERLPFDSLLHEAARTGEVKTAEVAIWERTDKLNESIMNAQFNWVEREAWRNRLLTLAAAVLSGVLLAVCWREERRHGKAPV